MIKRKVYTCYCSLALILFVTCCGLLSANGQPVSRPTNVKILSETKDKNGNLVRTIEYELKGKRIAATEIVPNNIGLHVPINPDTINRDSLLVVVNKSKFDLEVFYRRKIIRCYHAVFGPKPMENKRMQGDRNTPEGWFMIKSKNPKSKYNKFMLLDYPNDSSIILFNRMKQKGEIPRSAAIGGDVGIHGIWKGGDDMIEMGVSWTDGCIALKNKDIDDLYKLIDVGCRVYIRK